MGSKGSTSVTCGSKSFTNSFTQQVYSLSTCFEPDTVLGAKCGYREGLGPICEAELSSKREMINCSHTLPVDDLGRAESLAGAGVLETFTLITCLLCAGHRLRHTPWQHLTNPSAEA